MQNSATVAETEIFTDRVRRIVQWFHQSGVGADQLRNSQKSENVPEGKIKHLIGDIPYGGIHNYTRLKGF